MAEGTWAGKTATFTLTSAVEGKTGNRGSAYFMVSWDRKNVDLVNGGTYYLNFSGSTNWTLPLTLEPDGEEGDAQSTSKSGGWLSSDQGATSSKHQLGWNVYLDTGTAEHVNAPVIITDTPGPSSKIDISTVKGYSNGVEMSNTRYTVTPNGERGIKIELNGNYPGETAIYQGEDIYFSYKSDLLPGENGVFTNRAVVEGLEAEPQVVDAKILRDGAGGDGDGEVRQVVPVLPEVTQGVCEVDGSVSVPSLVLAETAGVSYEVAGDVVAGSTVVVTALADDGHVLAAADGWVLSDDMRSATAEVVFDVVPCEVPVVPVVPVLPEVTQGSGLAVTGDQLIMPLAGAAGVFLLLGALMVGAHVRRQRSTEVIEN